jgi:hypothetical protein
MKRLLFATWLFLLSTQYVISGPPARTDADIVYGFKQVQILCGPTSDIKEFILGEKYEPLMKTESVGTERQVWFKLDAFIITEGSTNRLCVVAGGKGNLMLLDDGVRKLWGLTAAPS